MWGGGGGNVEIPDKTPWEVKGWTQQEWLRWLKKRQPDTSSNRATLNPSWWLRKGIIDVGELDHYKRFSTSRETHAVTHQKTSLLSVIHTEYLFAWIGQIKVLKLKVNEQLIHAIFLQASERNHRGNQITK